MMEVYLGMPPPRVAAWLNSRSEKQDTGEDEIIWAKLMAEFDGETICLGSYLCAKNADGDFEDAYLDMDGKGVLTGKELFGLASIRFVEGDDEWDCEYIDPKTLETSGERLWVAERISPDCCKLVSSTDESMYYMVVRTTASDFYDAVVSGTNKIPSGTDLQYDSWTDSVSVWAVSEMLDHEYVAIECDDPEFTPLLCRRNPDFFLKQHEWMETPPAKYGSLQPVYVDGDGAVREIPYAEALAVGCIVQLTRYAGENRDSFCPLFEAKDGEIVMYWDKNPGSQLRVTGYDSLDDIPAELKANLEKDLLQKWNLNARWPGSVKMPFLGVRKPAPGETEVSNTVFAWNEDAKRYERVDIDGEGNILAVYPGDFYAYAAPDAVGAMPVYNYDWVACYEKNSGMTQPKTFQKVGNVYIIQLWAWEEGHKELSEYIELFDKEGAARFAAGEL